jgi:hypothetical protein
MKQSRLLVELFPDLFSNLEEGGDMFYRNVGLISEDYTALYPRRPFITTVMRSSTRLHCVTPQTTVILIFTAARSYVR